MIDLHSHILPGIDDGAANVDVSIEMARMAVADGITHMACTPHIFPGKYENSSAIILPAIQSLQATLNEQNIPLQLVCGADVHIALNLVDRIQAGEVPTLNSTRYFLLEPPHEVLPPRLVDLAAQMLDAGLVPIITHPERLLWVGRHYDVIVKLADLGCPLQITAGSILGDFGDAARKLAQRILTEGRAGIFASDAHGTGRRRPILSEAYKYVAEQRGEEEAEQMFHLRPAAILANEALNIPMPSRRGRERQKSDRRSSRGPARRFINRIFGDR